MRNSSSEGNLNFPHELVERLKGEDIFLAVDILFMKASPAKVEHSGYLGLSH